jgi:hypothetical protein
MCQANNSYEWFILSQRGQHHVRFYDFIDKIKTTNMATLPFPLKPRQTKGLGKLEHVGVAYLPVRPLPK